MAEHVMAANGGLWIVDCVFFIGLFFDVRAVATFQVLRKDHDDLLSRLPHAFQFREPIELEPRIRVAPDLELLVHFREHHLEFRDPHFDALGFPLGLVGLYPFVEARHAGVGRLQFRVVLEQQRSGESAGTRQDVREEIVPGDVIQDFIDASHVAAEAAGGDTEHLRQRKRRRTRRGGQRGPVSSCSFHVDRELWELRSGAPGHVPALNRSAQDQCR